MKVKGQVLLNGAPLSIQDAPPGVGEPDIILVPESEENVEAPGAVDSAGNFEFTDPEVQPGKYKLVIYLRSDMDTDELKEAFSHDNSPLIIDVPENLRGDTLDLGVMELSKHMSSP